MPTDHGHVWKSASLVKKFLTGVRGAVPLAAEQIDVMMRLIAARGQPPRRFLDLGCGDGILSEPILAIYPSASATLLDISEPMLEAARQRLAAFENRARYVSADYGHDGWTGPLGGGHFDLVVSGFSIHHQPDHRKQSIYRTIYQLLDPGGLFINIEHVSSPTQWIQKVHDEYFIDSLCATHRNGPERPRDEIASDYYHRDDKKDNILAPVEKQLQWLREYGFTDVDCYLKIFELAVFGGRRGAMQIS